MLQRLAFLPLNKPNSHSEPKVPPAAVNDEAFYSYKAKQAALGVFETIAAAGACGGGALLISRVKSGVAPLAAIACFVVGGILGFSAFTRVTNKVLIDRQAFYLKRVLDDKEETLKGYEAKEAMLNKRNQQLMARCDRVMREYDQMVARGVAPAIARRELLKVRDEMQAAQKEMVALKQNVKQAAAELDKAL